MPGNMVVLISGTGTNLQAIIKACQQGQLAGRVVAVIANRHNALGLERAKQHGIATELLKASDYPNRHSYDMALAERINAYGCDLLILAGFMRILSSEFVAHFEGKILNIHPSLLPKYPGLNTHQRAIDAGDTEHGCSVHFVTSELDGGPVILQARVPILPNDNAHSLAQRVQTQEHRIYPMVINLFLQKRLCMREQKAWLDNTCLGAQGALL